MTILWVHGLQFALSADMKHLYIYLCLLCPQCHLLAVKALTCQVQATVALCSWQDELPWYAHICDALAGADALCRRPA